MATTLNNDFVLFSTGQTIGASSSATMKNRLINSAMVIDQRNNGASVTNTAGVLYSVDRWNTVGTVSSKFTAQQNAGSVTPPVGYTNYLGVTSLSSYSVSSSDYFFLYQAIEGLNIADLAWGTANAKTVTLSFQVYSSLTGTFGGALKNSAGTTNYPFAYSIPVANTFTKISITIPGPTTGTWLTTNGVGIYVQFGLGAGSTFSGTAGSWQTTGTGVGYVSATGAVSVVGTSGATFYITGVQLEVGTVASSFDYRDYGLELIMCQRYLPILQSYSNGYLCMGYAQSPTLASLFYPFKVTPRVPPTGILITNVSSFGATSQGSAGTASSGSFSNASYDGCNFSLNTNASYTTGYPIFAYSNNSNGTIQFTGCEL